jgi:hypothetical protein
MAAAKKTWPLRFNAAVLDMMQRWSDDELHSVSAQIQSVLRDALRKAGRLKPGENEPTLDDDDT